MENLGHECFRRVTFDHYNSFEVNWNLHTKTRYNLLIIDPAVLA